MKKSIFRTHLYYYEKTLLFLGVAIAMFSCSKETSELQTNAPQPILKSSPMVFALPDEVNPNDLGIDQADTTITYSVIYHTDSVNTDTMTYSYSYSGENLISVKCDAGTVNKLGLSDDDIINHFTSECISNWEESYGKVMGRSKFGAWLERFFIGVKEEGPCMFGQYETWWNHWLVGIHSNDPHNPC